MLSNILIVLIFTIIIQSVNDPPDCSGERQDPRSHTAHHEKHDECLVRRFQFRLFVLAIALTSRPYTTLMLVLPVGNTR